MKKKLLITVCLLIVPAVIFCTPALASADNAPPEGDAAATVISELGKLLDLFPDNPQVMKVIDDAQWWLSREENAATITPEIASAVTAEVSNALATAGSATAASQLSASKQLNILNNVTRAASSAGLKLEASANYSSFVLKDASNNVVSSVALGNPIKQTGAGISIAGIVLAGTSMTLIAGFAVYIYIKSSAKASRRSPVSIKTPSRNPSGKDRQRIV